MVPIWAKLLTLCNSIPVSTSELERRWEKEKRRIGRIVREEKRTGGGGLGIFGGGNGEQHKEEMVAT